MTRVFVSGCYDILHAGHLQFFEEARALGDHLTVSFANEEILWKHKERKPSLPDDHKEALLRSLVMVDEVVAGNGLVEGLDFEPIFRELKPDILAVTESDLLWVWGGGILVLGALVALWRPLLLTTVHEDLAEKSFGKHFWGWAESPLVERIRPEPFQQTIDCGIGLSAIFKSG